MPPAKQHVEWWTKQAGHDLNTARISQQNGIHDACALMCQQCAEKYLKALFIKVHAATPPKIHQCDRLAAMLAAPASILSAAKELESKYMESRYPDAAQGVPFELFNDSDSKKYVRAAEKVQQWVLQQLAQTL